MSKPAATRVTNAASLFVRIQFSSADVLGIVADDVTLVRLAAAQWECAGPIAKTGDRSSPEALLQRGCRVLRSAPAGAGHAAPEGGGGSGRSAHGRYRAGRRRRSRRAASADSLV